MHQPVTLAVLPFQGLGEDRLSDALAEDIAGALSRCGGIAVTGSGASFACRSFADDIGRVIGELGVSHVLTGAIARSGDRLDIDVHLLRGASAAPIWSGSHRVTIVQLAGLHRTIARQVMVVLAPGHAAPRPASAAPRRNLANYDLLLRARSAIMRGSNADDMAMVSAGIGMAKQVAAQEPRWPEALRSLAWGYCQRAELGYFGPQTMPERISAIEAASRHRDLDPEDDSAHALLGHLAMRELRHETALASLRRAHALNPNNVMTLRWLAWEEANNELTDEAREHGAKSLRLSPCDRLVPQSHWTLALTEYVAGNLEACLDHARRAVAMRPRFAVHYIVLAACLAELGELSEAHYTLAAARTLSPWLVESRLAGICYFVAPALTERYVSALRLAAAGPSGTSKPEPSPGAAVPAPLGVLTRREHEVLRLVARGSSNATIAASLGISAHTSKRHIANVLAKLDLPNRAAAAGLAARYGVI